jgi:hypothetical protein
MKFIPFLFLIYYSVNSFAQSGCTDYRANNFNATALTNDGSCLYNYMQVSLQYISLLDSIVAESSGLALANSALWMHNDSDNPNSIYKIDANNGTLLQTVKIQNATNVDWEDATTDNNNLYIADFGNNAGSRTDLKIYKTIKNISVADTAINAAAISYVYTDQINFSTNPFTNFDAEAILHYNDSLYIFTKQWGNHKTKQYQLNKDSVAQIAKLIDSFDVQGLITASAISPDNKTVALLGYDTNGKSFVWLLWDFTGSAFFNGNKRRIDFGYNGGQCEGIEFMDNENVIISNESYSFFKASLQSLNISKWIGKTPLLNHETNYTKSNYDANTNTLQLNPNKKFNKLEIYNMQGQTYFKKSISNNATEIKLPNFNSGIFIIKISGITSEIMQIKIN